MEELWPCQIDDVGGKVIKIKKLDCLKGLDFFIHFSNVKQLISQFPVKYGNIRQLKITKQVVKM